MYPSARSCSSALLSASRISSFEASTACQEKQAPFSPNALIKDDMSNQGLGRGKSAAGSSSVHRICAPDLINRMGEAINIRWEA